MEKDLVLIASGGRTGTTFFGKHLSSVIGGSFSEHEPDLLAQSWSKSLPRIRKFGLWHMVFGRILGVSGLRVLGHKFLAGRLSEGECIKRLRQQREGYFNSIPEPLVIESNGRYWMLATILHKAFPRSRVIGIIRDPRSWVESWLRHQPGRHTKSFIGWFPMGPFTPGEVGDEAWADRWRDLDQFGRLAWDWRAITGELVKAADEAPNVKLYRFEDLFEGKAIQDLVDFASFDGTYEVHDLDGFTSRVSNASSGPRRSWSDWPDEQARLLDEMCGPLMERFGYGGEPEWKAKVGR